MYHKSPERRELFRAFSMSYSTNVTYAWDVRAFSLFARRDFCGHRVLMDQALRNGFIKLLGSGLESNFSAFDFCTVQRYVSSFNSCAKRGF